MKYGLTLVPQGSIPRNLGLKLKLTPQTVGAPPQGGGCQDIFAGYFVSGIPSDLVVQNTYDWPGGTWTAVITGFAFTCGPAVYTWTVTPGNFSVATPPIWTDSLDSNGRPVLTVTGDATDELDGPVVVLDIVLNINGKPVDQHVTLKPAVLNYYINYAGASGSALAHWSISGFDADVSSGGVAASLITLLAGANTFPDGDSITFLFNVFNEAGAGSTFSVDSSAMGIGAAVTVDTSGGSGAPLAISIVFTPSVGDCSGQINFTATDSLLGTTAPRAGGFYNITIP